MSHDEENSVGGYTCEECDGSGHVEVTMTNADRIRAMTDEELALFVRAFINSSHCPYDWKGCENCWLKELCNANAYNGELEWLQQPAEGD